MSSKTEDCEDKCQIRNSDPRATSDPTRGKRKVLSRHPLPMCKRKEKYSQSKLQDRKPKTPSPSGNTNDRRSIHGKYRRNKSYNRNRRWFGKVGSVWECRAAFRVFVRDPTHYKVQRKSDRGKKTRSLRTSCKVIRSP